MVALNTPWGLDGGFSAYRWLLKYSKKKKIIYDAELGKPVALP
jgi:hypothetical protein